jgi:hypothetical protein
MVGWRAGDHDDVRALPFEHLSGVRVGVPVEREDRAERRGSGAEPARVASGERDNLGALEREPFRVPPPDPARSDDGDMQCCTARIDARQQTPATVM